MKHPLKIWREDNGLSQEAAARKVGVTKQCWQFWESGQRMPERLHVRKIAKLTGISGDQLYARVSA